MYTAILTGANTNLQCPSRQISHPTHPSLGPRALLAHPGASIAEGGVEATLEREPRRPSWGLKGLASCEPTQHTFARKGDMGARMGAPWGFA